MEDIVLIGWSTGNLDTWSYVQQFGKNKLRGVVTIDMSPLPLSPDPKWWTEGTIEELSQVATQVLTSSQGCREFFSEYATDVMIQHKMEPDELEYLLDISGRTPYWICRQLFCDAVFSNYLQFSRESCLLYAFLLGYLPRIFLQLFSKNLLTFICRTPKKKKEPTTTEE